MALLASLFPQGLNKSNPNFKFYVISRDSERSQFQIQRAQLENYRSLQDRIQDAETWRDVLQKKLRESEIQSKQLRDQQRSIREQKVEIAKYEIDRNCNFSRRKKRKKPLFGET